MGLSDYIWWNGYPLPAYGFVIYFFILSGRLMINRIDRLIGYSVAFLFLVFICSRFAIDYGAFAEIASVVSAYIILIWIGGLLLAFWTPKYSKSFLDKELVVCWIPLPPILLLYVFGVLPAK